MNKSEKKSSGKFGFFVKILPAFVIGLILGGLLFLGFGPTGPEQTNGTAPAAAQEPAEETVWTCSMHPQIKMPDPGLCPICNMELIPLVQDTADDVVGGFVQFTASPAAAALMDVQTAPVERKFVTANVRMVGKVEYDETRVEYITAWVPGRLDRLFVDYTGVPVRKGDHMVYLYSPELLSAQEELLQAIKAVEGVEQSRSEMIREMTAGTVNAAREKLRLLGLTEAQISEIEQRGTASDHITIYSPTGGIVVHKNAREGMYVDTGTRIYTVADLSHVWVKLDAYESDLAWLRYGQTVEFGTVAYPGKTFEGTISFIDPMLDPMTRTVNIRVDVPNPQGLLKPDMFVKAVVHAEVAAAGKVMDPDLAGKWICPMHPSEIEDQPGDCGICGMPLVRTESLGYVSIGPEQADKPLVIPASAALVTGKRAVVYVQVPDAEKPTFEGREVVLGPRAGDYYLVESGLEEGQMVVTKGNFKIDSALQIQAKPSMMMPREQTAEQLEEMEGGAAKLELSEAVRRQLAAVYEAYFTMQPPLFNGDLPATAETVGRLKAAIEQVDMTAFSEAGHILWMKHLEALGDIIADAASADTIEQMREAFSLLSEDLYALASRVGAPTEPPIYQVHCPMAFNNRGANWLQPDDTVRNPYFGDAMPGCGAVTETIEPASVDEPGDSNE